MKKTGRELNKLNYIDYIIMIVLGIWALVIFYPFYNTILVSLVTQRTYVRTPFLIIPNNITFDSYLTLLSYKPMINGFKVSSIVVILGVIYTLLMTVSMAFAMTKKFPGQKLIMTTILIPMYFGGGLIPTYVIMTRLGLIDNIAALILPVGLNFYYMFLIRNYFQSLPPSLEESAKIDGANDIVILFRIILPLALPVIATIVLFCSVDLWNSWFGGLIYIKTAEKRPLQLVMRSLIIESSAISRKMASSGQKREYFTDGLKMGAVVVTMLPVMIIYPFLQKYFMKGIMIGAVKS